MSDRTTKSSESAQRAMPADLRNDINQLHRLVEELKSAIVETRAAAEASVRVSRELSEAFLNGVRRPLASARQATRRSARPVQSTLESARQAGQVQLVAWVEEGALMASEEFAAKWGMTPQGLQKAAARGELPAIKVSNRTYYPAVLCELPRPFASHLGQALRSLSPARQLIFLLRRHGGLDGKSIGDLTTSAEQARALELAQSWAAEELDAA